MATSDGCSECFSGYVRKARNGTKFFECVVTKVKCASMCSNCDKSNGTCLGCSRGYYLVNNRCLKCDQGCESCTNQGVCTSCKESYFLDNGSCLSCGSGCKKCKNNRKCYNCHLDHYMSENSPGKCKPCPIGCAECNNGRECLSCNFTYKLVNGVCESKTWNEIFTDLAIIGAILFTIIVSIMLACKYKTKKDDLDYSAGQEKRYQ